MKLHRDTLLTVGLAVFGVVLFGFFVRGFGQFIVGPRTALLLAGPFFVAGAVLLVVVIGLWVLGWIGVLEIETGE